MSAASVPPIELATIKESSIQAQHPKPCPAQSSLALSYLLSSHPSKPIIHLIKYISTSLGQSFPRHLLSSIRCRTRIDKAQRSPTHSAFKSTWRHRTLGPSADPSESAKRIIFDTPQRIISLPSLLTTLTAILSSNFLLPSHPRATSSSLHTYLSPWSA